MSTLSEESGVEQVIPATLLPQDSVSNERPVNSAIGTGFFAEIRDVPVPGVLMTVTGRGRQLTVSEVTGALSDGVVVSRTPPAGVGLRHQYLIVEVESGAPHATTWGDAEVQSSTSPPTLTCPPDPTVELMVACRQRS
jgi:hypothetical protein